MPAKSLQLRPSTAIMAAAYDPELEQLDVTFVNGKTYNLKGVPPDVADGFEAADSPGRYWHDHLAGMY